MKETLEPVTSSIHCDFEYEYEYRGAEYEYENEPRHERSARPGDKLPTLPEGLFPRTKGPAVYLAQSKELKVPQGWVFCRIMNWSTNGPAVNCRAVGPQLQLTNPVPSPANLRFLGWAEKTIGPLVLEVSEITH